MQIRGTRLRDQALTPDIRATLAPVLRLLSSADGPLVVLGLGLVLCLPALLTGFSLADDILRLNAHGHRVLPVERPAWDLFSWLGSEEGEARAVADLTGLWSLPADATVRAPRPLTSLLHAGEQRLWPGQAWAMHLHNIVWYALLLAAAALLFREFLGAGWIAATALLVYAFDDAHGPAVAAITGRHQLIAAACGAVTLLAHHRWRADGWTPGLWVGPVTLAIGLAASETAMTTVAFLFAYVIVLERAPGPQQWATFAGYAGVAAVWTVVVGLLGYSVADPLANPGLALATIVERLPLLALAQAGIPYATSLADLPGAWAALASALAATVAGGIGWLLTPLFERQPMAAFWGLATLLSLVPASLGAGGESALLFPGIGFAALLAQFFAAVLYTARGGRVATLRAPIVALAGIWVALHVVVAPLLLPVRAIAPLFADARLDAIETTLPTDAALADQQLVIVNAPNLEAGPGLLARRAAVGAVLPQSARILSVAAGAVEVERADDDRLILRVDQAMAPVPLGAAAPAFALAAARFAEGDEIEIEGFRARVDAVASGRATRLEFTFDVPCENESLRWVAWDGEAYRPFAVPAVGETVRVGAP
jgi:hypothetical protein